MGMQTDRPRALVTGASSGIGAAFAERLAHEGYDLIVVARRRERLEELAKRLEAANGMQVEVIVAALTVAAEIEYVETRIADADGLAILVNNAGSTVFSPFAQSDPHDTEVTIQLQVVAPTRLTRAALPGMIARASGAIINVSSLMAYGGRPLRATYIGTKAYLNAFTEVLHTELRGTGVQVQALCPGLVDTEIFAKVGMDTSQLPPSVLMSPEDAVTASLAGLKLGELYCLPSLGDDALLAQIRHGRTQIMEQAFTGVLAGRYREYPILTSQSGGGGGDHDSV